MTAAYHHTGVFSIKYPTIESEVSWSSLLSFYTLEEQSFQHCTCFRSLQTIMQNYYIRIEDMLSLVSHKLSIIKYVVLKKIFFFLCFDRLIWTWTWTRTTLDSVLTRTRTSLDSVLTRTRTSLDLDLSWTRQR